MGFALGVRDSIMIAHSFTGKEFGPAQGLHGATYTVDCEFSAPALAPKLNWLIDIGTAKSLLKDVLLEYNYKNLDEIEELKGQNTTTEFMCLRIHQKLAAKLRETPFRGGLKITLWESHDAWASYSGEVTHPHEHTHME